MRVKEHYPSSNKSIREGNSNSSARERKSLAWLGGWVRFIFCTVNKLRIMCGSQGRPRRTLLPYWRLSSTAQVEPFPSSRNCAFLSSDISTNTHVDSYTSAKWRLAWCRESFSRAVVNEGLILELHHPLRAWECWDFKWHLQICTNTLICTLLSQHDFSHLRRCSRYKKGTFTLSPHLRHICDGTICNESHAIIS